LLFLSWIKLPKFHFGWCTLEAGSVYCDLEDENRHVLCEFERERENISYCGYVCHLIVWTWD